MAPPGGADEVSDTLTVTGSPEATTPGKAATDEMAAAAAGLTVKATDALAVPRLTVTVTGVAPATVLPVTANCPNDEPPLIGTVLGTVRLVLDAFTLNVSPPDGAAGDTTTWMTSDAPEATDDESGDSWIGGVVDVVPPPPEARAGVAVTMSAAATTAARVSGRSTARHEGWGMDFIGGSSAEGRQRLDPPDRTTFTR